MSTSISSVQGNKSFTKVDSLAGHLSDLNVSDAKVASLTADVVTAKIVSSEDLALGKQLHYVTGYAPTEFSTAAINSVFFLNTKPGQSAATAVTDSKLLLLPTSSQVVSVYVNNNGTPITSAGAVTFDVGTEVWSAAPTGTSDLITGSPYFLVNNGVSASSGGAITGLGTAGTSSAPIAAVAANTGISVQALVSTVTAGDLAVTVSYVV